MGQLFVLKVMKEAKIERFSPLSGATDVTRTHDLLITKYTKSAQGAVSGPIWRFCLQNRLVSGILYSVDSIHIFRIVGHGVGQALETAFTPH